MMLCAAALLIASAVDAPAPASNLELARPQERVIQATEVHLYQLSLETGQLVRGVVDQRGISINVKGYFPDGSKIRSFNGPSTGIKSFRFVAEAPGTYRLELRAADSGSPGSYRIEIQQIQPMAERLRIPREEKYVGRRIEALGREIVAGNQAALAEFWTEVERRGTPLVEPLEGDDENVLVTFLWRAAFETHNVLVVWAPYTFEHLDDYQMVRLADTDVWHKTLRVPKGARFSYQLSPNDTLSRSANAQRYATAQLDPLNQRRSPDDPNLTKYEVSSIAELPGAPPQPWIQPRAGIPKGTIEQHRIASALLGNERSVSVYTPHGYTAEGDSYPLALLFDESAYLTVGCAKTTLDNLIADQRISPLVAVFIGNIDDTTRSQELPCNPTFADFLHQELLPWVRRAYHVTTDPREVTVGGVSYGGLAAVYASLRHPESFGNVLCQSGALWWMPGQNPNQLRLRTGELESNWLARQFIRSPKLPVRFFIEAGLFENDIWGTGGQILERSRHLRDVLLAKGCDVRFQEFAGGHSFANWRGSLADGLIALSGMPPRQADALDALVERSLARYNVPGASIAVIQNAAIGVTRTYGALEANASRRVDDETIFQAASISKPVAAMAVLRMVQDDRFGLDQDVNEILDTWSLPSNQFTSSNRVTIRRILSHTAGLTVSGFPGYQRGEPLPTLVQILDGAAPANTPPVVVDAEPGSVYRYSGGGYTILSLLVAEQSGKPFADALAEMVLRPLGMAHSTFEQDLPEHLARNVARAHDRNGVVVDGGWRRHPELAPDGLWTTPSDVARFAIEVARSLRGQSNLVLNENLTRMMVTRELGAHGLGFVVNGEERSFRFRHDGTNKGYCCQLVYYPELDEGVVVMTNGGRGHEVISEIIGWMRSQYDWPQ